MKKLTAAMTPKKTKKLSHHLMWNVLEPVIRTHNEYDYTYRRTFLTHLQLLGQLRSRVNFFAIFNLFDKSELEQLQSKKFMEMHKTSFI